MQQVLRGCAVALALVTGAPTAALSAEPVPGASVDSLLEFARERNPEYAAMRFEAEAAGERVAPAGALPDPRLRTELMDITKSGEQNPSLLPGQIGRASCRERV